MEHILYHAIIEHLNLHHILEDHQFGFRSGYSCETQLVTVVEDILAAMDQRCQVDVILLDLSKAFNTVLHQRLLKKLHNYGICSNVLKWISTWLTRTSCNFAESVASHIFLWHLVSSANRKIVENLTDKQFLVYINDISGGISSNIRLFTDDCILYRIIKETHDQDIIQADINQLIKWSEIWQMTFNASKCVYSAAM